MRFENALMVGVTLLVASACAPTVVMLVPERFPPAKNVEILFSEPQDRPYVEIARLSIKPFENNGLSDFEIDAIVVKARELGADAVIFGGATGQSGTRGYKWYDPALLIFSLGRYWPDTTIVQHHLTAIAVAIRFTDIPLEKR